MPEFPARKKRPASTAIAPPAARWRRLLKPVFGVLLFGLALWSLYGTLRQTSFEEIMVALRALPRVKLAEAVTLTVVSYLGLTLYDLLGFRFIAHPLPWRRIVLASFIGYALGNAASNAMAGGAAVRYWIYSSFGIDAGQIARVVFFCSIGFWLGYLALAALLFCTSPLAAPAALRLPFATVWPLGLLFLAALAVYLLLVIRRRPLLIFRWHFSLPTLPLTLGQIGVAILDILTMSSVLWTLLPSSAPLTYAYFLQIFLLALIIGAVSQVPAGLGVFETSFLVLLPSESHTPGFIVALLAFRALYFLAPLLLAAALAGLGVARRR